jgi:hypothetical protein
LLRLDFIQFYSGPASLINYRDSTRWAQVTNYNLPWQVNTRWFDSLNHIFYGNANAANLGLVYAAGSIRGITTGAEGAEDYYTTPPGTPLGQVFDYRFLPNIFARIGLDTLLNGGAYGGRFSSGTAPLQIAGNPIYTSEGLARFGEGYDLIGKQVDALKYDLTVVMKAEFPTPDTVGNNDILLYVKVYRRVPIGQDDTCRCGIYDKVDSFAVTKGIYNDANVTDTTKDGYHNINFTTEFPDAARFARGDELRIQISNNDTIHLPTHDSIVPPGWLTAWASGDSLQQYTYHGGFFGWASAAPNDSIPGCSRYCARLTDQLVSYGYLSSDHKSMWAVEGSDIIFDIHTTRKVPVTFVRTRIGPRSFTYLRRGLFDQVINSTIDSIFADDTLRRLTYRFGVNDEQNNRKYSTYREAGSRIQRRILYNDSTDKRGLWANPMRFFDAFRIHSGDLDTTDIRIVHMMANQFYGIANSGMPVPVHYANPDSMVIRYGADIGKPSPALYSYWRAGVDTMARPRMIAFNNEDHYKAYTELMQSRLQGMIDMMWDNLNVSRRKFRHIRSESYPVSQVVQVHGYVGKNGNGWLPYWDLFRPATPEEISAQCWLVLQSCQDGIVFSDFAFDGSGEFGVMHWVGGDHSENYYDSLSPHSPISQAAGWKLPRMWSGFKDRFNAIKRFTNYFRDTLQPVYDSLDRDRAIHMSVHRGDGFAAMPLLDTVVTVRAKRDRDSAGHYQDSTVSGIASTDSLQQTYLEATVYAPRADFSEHNTWFLMVTNRRIWPVDYTSYSSGVGSWGSTNSAAFGARDVRKPVIVLKNATGMISDSFRIQRVGTATWQTVAVNANVELDWLEPGWGAMYRVKAIPRGVSARGVAYNNSQRVENPSLDTLARPRIAVYERDSIIYMRLNHRNGMWSAEVRVSDSADADSASRAWCLNPAVAVVRNGNSALVTWERRHNSVAGSSRSSIRARYYCAFPDTGALPPNTVFTISDTLKLGNDSLRTHAVIGLDSGYVVAWGTPYNGIELAAIRDTVFNSGNYSNYISLSGTRVRAGNVSVKRLGQSPVNLDSLSVFPTLAYVRNRQSVFFSQTHDVYLSWQQGGGASGVGPFIFFTPVGIKFTPGQKPTIVATAAIEHVSRDLPGCRFIHPCIAADTLRVGVTFEAVEQISWKGIFNSPSTHVVVLRFRDSVTTGGQILLRWKTPAYAWSNGNGIYQFPSVVQFPNVPRTTLRSAVPGGLTWYAPDATGDSKVMLYQYRQRGLDSSLRGVDPTMVRSPFTRLSTAYSTSGLFYREPDKNRDTATSPFGYSSLYYGAHLENTPSVPSALFVNSTPQGGAIFANFVLRQTAYDHSSCDIPAIIGGLVIRNPIDPGDDGYWIPIGIKFVTGLPPSFFAEPDSGNTVVDTITKISTVVRTGEFHAPSGGVTIQWGIQGSSQLGTWLQNAPNDSLLNIPANIVASLQLVRASNNSVLWTSDTVSALSLMSPDPVGFETDIAADSLAGVDSLVYVRMVVYAPINLDYTMSTGFQFIEDPVNYFPKRVRRSNGDESLGEAMLSLSVHPNPVNDKMTTVVVTSPFGDNPTTLKLYDITGNLLFDLGTVVLRDGYGSGQLNVSNLKAGVYSLVVQQKGRVASTKLTVIR